MHTGAEHCEKRLKDEVHVGRNHLKNGLLGFIVLQFGVSRKLDFTHDLPQPVLPNVIRSLHLDLFIYSSLSVTFMIFFSFAAMA